MAAALARSARCQACRYNILQTFVALSGLSIAQTVRFPIKSQVRSFSAAPCLRTESSDHSTSAATNDSKQQGQPTNNSNTLSQSVPWYLRVESPVEEPHHVAQRQEIPPVPENSPAIMKDLLQNLSVEIGLDDLTLLDLRGRDQPSALGGNVIMVIGTARSLKHLNVSADRFCRWLRSTYKLNPHADGLLGRNELKIKLRRKARRARIAGSSGATATTDDGITTGWICVNVGLVDDPSANHNVKEGVFEGFGKTQSGTRVVVQMFTEEKRADIDLEQLWAPKRKGQHSESEIRNEALNEDANASHPGSSMTNYLDSKSQFSNLVRPHPVIPFSQRRGFTTSSKKQISIDTGTDHNTSRPADKALSSYELLNPFRKEREACPTLESARDLLGSGPHDCDSTDFLQRCHAFVKGSLNLQAALRLMLAAHGVTTRHPMYTKEYMWKVFMEHTASDFPLSNRQALEIADAFLTPRSPLTQQVPLALREFDVESAFRVLDHLSLRGSLRLDSRHFGLLYKALLMSSSNEDAEIIQQKSIRIRKAMETLLVPLDFDKPGATEIMHTRLQLKDVKGFWKMWHAIPFTKGSRTHEDYVGLFHMHAIIREPALARECLATWIPMMPREDPPIVPNNELLWEIACCVCAAGYRHLDFTPEMSSPWWQKFRPSIFENLKAVWKKADAYI